MSIQETMKENIAAVLLAANAPAPTRGRAKNYDL